jgi:hypothetical protein
MLGGPEKKKRLGSLRQQAVFSDQILRLRPQNDKFCSALLNVFVAIRSKSPICVCGALAVKVELAANFVRMRSTEAKEDLVA